jgi:hypothetical protein
MLGETFVLPRSSGSVTLVRINQDGFTTLYRFNDSTKKIEVTVRHIVGQDRLRKTPVDIHTLEVVETVYQVGDVAEYERRDYLTFRRKASDTSIENVDAICDYLIASANSKLISIMNWEG